MHFAGVNYDIIIWVLGELVVFSFRAETASLLSCLFTLQIPMTAALIPGKRDHLLSQHLLAVMCMCLTQDLV